MKLIILAALVAASMAVSMEPSLWGHQLNHNEIMELIRHRMVVRDLEKRKFGDKIKHAFQSVGHWCKEHCVELAGTAASVVPLILKREAELDERAILGERLNNWRHHEMDLLRRLEGHNLAKRGFFGKIGDAFKKVGKTILPVVEQAGLSALPVLFGKRESEELAKRNFFSNIGHKLGDAFKKVEHAVLPVALDAGEKALLSAIGKRESEELAKRGFFKNVGHFLGNVGKAVLPVAEQALVTSIGKRESLLGRFEDRIHHEADLLRKLEGTHHLRVTRSFSSWISGVGNTILNGFKSAGSFIEKELPTIAESAIELAPTVVSLVGKRSAENEFVQHLDIKIKEGLHEILENINKALKGVLLIGYNLATDVEGDMQQLVDGTHIKAIAQKFLDKLTHIADVFKNISNLNLDDMFKNLIPNALKKVLENHKRSLLPFDLSGVIGDVRNMLEDGATGLSQMFQGIVRTAENLVKPTIENVKSMASSFLNTAKSLTAAGAKQALQVFAPFASTLGPLWNQIQQTINPVLNAGSQ